MVYGFKLDDVDYNVMGDRNYLYIYTFAYNEMKGVTVTWAGQMHQDNGLGDKYSDLYNKLVVLEGPIIPPMGHAHHANNDLA